MNMFRAFMELDKLNESSPSKLSMINDLKAWGKAYKSLEQRPYGQVWNIWDKERRAQDEQQAYAELATIPNEEKPTCDECGRTLTDGGFCPVCDDGAEDLYENAVDEKHEYQCDDCGFVGYFYDEDVADGCCPQCHNHHGNFNKCEDVEVDPFSDARLEHLKTKPKYAWSDADWELYLSCTDNLDIGLSEDFLTDIETPSGNGWVSRVPAKQQPSNQQSQTPAQTSTQGTNIVTIFYDYKAQKLRARADDGIHGPANVAFPNSLRNRVGQQYKVDDLVWNGKNYRAVGNIVAI